MRILRRCRASGSSLLFVGVAGAFVGGWLGTQLGFGSVSGFDFRSLVIAVVGALLLLFLNRKLRTRRAG